MRLLITGGAGFIGSNLARDALRRGHQVTVLDNFSTGYESNLDGLDVRRVTGSVADPDVVDDALAGTDSVVHLAALGSVPRSIEDPMASHDSNATGTLTVLHRAAAAGVEHVVVSSSSSVYGLNPALPKDEREWVRPMSPYAVTKLATEQYALAFQQSYGLRTLAFRFFNVYGPGQRAGHAYAAVIPVFVDAMLRGQPVPVNGDGNQSRDFTFVGTVCGVLLDACERQVTYPEPVNLAFGTNTSVNHLVTLIAEATGVEPRVEHRPSRAGDVPHSQARNDRLRALFPSTTAVELDDGIARTVAWMRETR